MPEISIEIEVFCSCGEGLCHQSTGDSGTIIGYRNRGPSITVEPCEKCQDRARQEGYQDGYDSAHEEIE